jgi:hypothetical protein
MLKCEICGEVAPNQPIITDDGKPDLWGRK